MWLLAWATGHVAVVTVGHGAGTGHVAVITAGHGAGTGHVAVITAGHEGHVAGTGDNVVVGLQYLVK